MIGKALSFIEGVLFTFALWVYGRIYVQERELEKKPRLFWGTVPILNFKYWNEAMKLKGYDSVTLMTGFYNSINKKEDFDLYYPDIKKPLYIRLLNKIPYGFNNLSQIYLMFYITRNFDVLNISYEGVIFSNSRFWNKELDFYKKMGMKIVCLPYGGDYQRYSKLYNKSWHHALLINYPRGVFNEQRIDEKIDYFVRNADCIMAGFQFDQISRWDILPYAVYPMNTDLWKPKKIYSENDGVNGVVKVYHTPNHKSIKGSEFLIEAVKQLKEEGLLVDLVLLEGVQNDRVRVLLHNDADILVEQLILGFALSALEGMATGLPVISNLEEENQTRVFRRFSYLNECPILSSNPEKIKKDLKLLITNPALRKQLGVAGVSYVEKYHSFQAMSQIFTAIYDKIWFGKDVDLINFFNPMSPESYNNRSPKIEHPLFENSFTLEN